MGYKLIIEKMFRKLRINIFLYRYKDDHTGLRQTDNLERPQKTLQEYELTLKEDVWSSKPGIVYDD